MTRKLDCVLAMQSVLVWFSSSQLFFSFFPFKTCHAYIVNLEKQPASLIQNVSGFIVRSFLFSNSTDDVLLIAFAVITAYFFNLVDVDLYGLCECVCAF